MLIIHKHNTPPKAPPPHHRMQHFRAYRANLAGIRPRGDRGGYLKAAPAKVVEARHRETLIEADRRCAGPLGAAETGPRCRARQNEPLLIPGSKRGGGGG